MELHADVEREIDRDHIAHDCHADQRTECGRAAKAEEYSSHYFAGSPKRHVGGRGAHERPEKTIRRGFPECLAQALRAHRGKLRRQDLAPPVGEKIGREKDAKIRTQSLVETAKIRSTSIESGPDR